MSCEAAIQARDIEVEIARVAAEYFGQYGLEVSATSVILFSIGYVIRRIVRAKAANKPPSTPSE